MNRFAEIIPLFALILLSSCRGGNRSPVENKPSRNDQYVAGRYHIDEINGIRRVTIHDPWQNSRGTEMVYYLVPSDQSLPDTLTERQVITIPARRIICMSTTHLAMLKALGASDMVVGISGSDLIYDSCIIDALKNGNIHDVGYESNLNMEMIVTLRPDLLIAYNIGAPAEQFRKLEDMGIKVLYNADYLEQHPLGRCSWIRLFGAITGRDEAADSIFREVSMRYNALADMVQSKAHGSPDVLLGAPWEDVWYVSPSNSYTGRLIADAGGHYLFSDLQAQGAVPLSVEAVFSKASDADLWINPGSAGSLNDLMASDRRMAQLPAFRTGQVWNNNKRVTPYGGNDYWESGVVRPDLLLQDFVSIIHPELMPDYSQFFYIKLR